MHSGNYPDNLEWQAGSMLIAIQIWRQQRTPKLNQQGGAAGLLFKVVRTAVPPQSIQFRVRQCKFCVLLPSAFYMMAGQR